MPPIRHEIKKLFGNVFQPPTQETTWEWADKHFRIPQIIGSPNPGLFDSSQMPFWRGIFDLLDHPKTRHIAIRKSARIGGTLFTVITVLHRIATKPAPILWVEPSRKTAVRLSRNELEPFILECKPVDALAVKDKQNWTTLEKNFTACTWGIVGAGSASELAGRQAEVLALNETDKLAHSLSAEAPAHDLAIARTMQFIHTRKIIENSTPTVEWGRANQAFLKGKQYHIYVPCPKCKTKQRLTFFSEEKEVPFDEHGKPIDGKRVEKTGRFKFDHLREDKHAPFDLDLVERQTVYECAHCQHDITHDWIGWMNDRYELRSHNPKAPYDNPSVHVWGAHSPYQTFGSIAKEFLLSKGSIGRMHNFYNSFLGLPFVRKANEIKDADIDRVIARSPEYMIGQLPAKPLMLTMTVDVQQSSFWWSVQAWGVVEGHPDLPPWMAIVDYGHAVSWEVIQEVAGIKESDGKRNGYTYDGETYQVLAGLVDSGYAAKQNHRVYQFCLENPIFSPSKGGGWELMRGKVIRTSTIEWEGSEIELVSYADEIAKEQLYYVTLKDEREHFWLPRNVGQDFRAQLQSERTKEVQKPDGTTKLQWTVEGEAGNHLADTIKMALVLREAVVTSEAFDKRREELEKEMAKTND
jgi:phage terminase large subunit GpA-like protein